MHGPAGLIVHAVIGLTVIASGTHQFVWNLKWGTRGATWATGVGLLLVLAAGFSGEAFLTYSKDLDSLLMALFFGAAMLCYATSIYLLLRPGPATEPAGRGKQ